MATACGTRCVIGVAFDCDDITADELARMLFVAVANAAELNVRWYLEQFANPTPEAYGYPADAEWPPCCPSCAGIVHNPDLADYTTGVAVVQRILHCGEASCGGAAAMQMGYEIALPIFEGTLSEAEAYARVDPDIDYGRSPNGDARGRYFHARFRLDGKIVDPTKEMEAA